MKIGVPLVSGSYTSYDPDDMVERFHEILIWPLELALPPQLLEAASRPGFVNTLCGAVEERGKGVWKRIGTFDRNTTKDRDLRYAEFVYFHPFVQRVLYPQAHDPNPALAILARHDVSGVKVTLHGENAALQMKVDRVHLYLFRSQTALLVVEVSSQAPMPLATVQQFLDQFRRAYAPFHKNAVAGHCPSLVEWCVSGASPGNPPAASNFSDPCAMYEPVENPDKRRPPMAAHWRWLMQPLVCAADAGPGDIGVEQLEDDRIPAMSYLAVPDPFALTRGDFMRICFCDEKGCSNSLPYGTEFLSDFERRFCYDRFWNPPGPSGGRFWEWRNTRYLCSGYHFATIVKTSPEPPGWAEKILDDFQHHYFQMGVLAHFHRASLLKYSRRLTEVAADAEHQEGGEKWTALMHVRRAFAEFVNQYWFREVSNQEQAKEMFQLWSDRLGNRDLLQQLSTEAEAVDRILNSVDEAHRRTFEKEQQQEIRFLTKVIIGLAVFTVLVAVLDSDAARKLFTLGGKWFLQGRRGDDFKIWLPLFACTVGFLLLGGVGLWRIFRWLDKKEQSHADQNRGH
jgi:hypothetical protein